MSTSNALDSDETGQFARVNRVMLSKKSEEYRQRRERNNAAVKKSRYKSKQKTIETQQRVEELKQENIQLERRLESLVREFQLMKNLFAPRREVLLMTQQQQHQEQQHQLQQPNQQD